MEYRIVILDDEKEISGGFAMFFPWKSLGFSVAAQFTDAQNALEFLKQEEVDVLISDVRMPGMDGIETTKIIRTKNGKCMEVPIIAMTADGFETDIGMLQKAGMNGLISKPVDVNTLVEHITKLAGW